MTTRTTRWVGVVFGACVLAILFALASPATAKPDGGHGATQGASESNPDDGGVDKPYAAAGHDARTQGDSDWDGNNGCGNDDDRADDNNGHCGKPHDRGGPPPTNPGQPTVNALSASGAQVMGVQITAAAAAPAVAAPAAPAAQVLGTQVAAAEPLAATGLPLGLLALIGLALLAVGALTRRLANAG